MILLRLQLSTGLLKYVELLSCCLLVLIFLGEMMMVMTSIYFHTLVEKLFGAGCGLGSWFLIYQIIYPTVMSDVGAAIP